MKRGLNSCTEWFHTTPNWESNSDKCGSILGAAIVTSPALSIVTEALFRAIATMSHLTRTLLTGTNWNLAFDGPFTRMCFCK